MEHFYGGLLEGLLALDIVGSLLWRSKCSLKLIGGVRISHVIAFQVIESFPQLPHSDSNFILPFILLFFLFLQIVFSLPLVFLLLIAFSSSQLFPFSIIIPLSSRKQLSSPAFWKFNSKYYTSHYSPSSMNSSQNQSSPKFLDVKLDFYLSIMSDLLYVVMIFEPVIVSFLVDHELFSDSLFDLRGLSFQTGGILHVV